MAIYKPDEVPKCQWDSCNFEAVSKVYNEDCTESLLVCRAHRGVVEINLETSGKLRLSQSNNQMATGRPGRKPDNTGKRPTVNPDDWQKEAAMQADASATPMEQSSQEENFNSEVATDRKAIIGDLPTPRRVD